MTRDTIQQEIINLVQKSNRIALQWCTGLGKSKAAIDILQYLDNLRFLYTAKKSLNVLLVVAETAHKLNWKKEFDKWGYPEDDVTIICYASLKNFKDTKWDMIIFDEAHHLASELRISMLNTIVADNILLLSATIDKSIMDDIEAIYGEFAISKITLNDAIEWDILPKPKIYTIPLYLDNVVQNHEIIENLGKKPTTSIVCTFENRWKYLKHKDKYPNAKLIIKCTERQKYYYLSDQYDFWNRRFKKIRKEYAKNKWLQIGLERKRFLGDIKSKYVKILLDKLSDTRYICFCNNIEQVEYLGGEYCIHSKKRNSIATIESFNNEEINHLFAVGMLQEGQNLHNIKAGIIVQLDGTERSFIQKFGRSMRAEDPAQYIFYYPGTRDEEYLLKVLKDINPEYIEEYDLYN